MKFLQLTLRLRTYLLALILMSTGSYKAQLSGTVVLEGQSNASGVKVKFTANSGGAVTDSCMSDASGNFSITIIPGVYKIAYTKIGFHYVYNNTTTQVLTNSTVLTTKTMSIGHATFVNGNVSGTWSDTTIYYATGDLVIANNTSLTISPGTKIKFLGYYKIISDGVLKAEGTSTKRIVFTLQDSSVYWDKLDLNNDACVLHYCTVEYLMTGIVIHKNAEVSDCIVRKVVETGIAIYSGSAKIVNNEVYDFRKYGIGSTGKSAILCNNVHHDRYQEPTGSSSAGIYADDSSLVMNNNIHHTYTGIRLRNNATVKNNFIHNNEWGGYCYIENFPYEGTQIINNTFLDNTVLVMFYDGGSSTKTKFINNIVVNSQNGIGNKASGTYEYNLIYNCGAPFNTVAPVGIGNLITTNANGDSTDAYFNVFVDPKFSINNAPYLQQNSPALNAGNSLFSSSIGANAASICYQNIITGLPVPKIADTEVRLFPNPNPGIFTLRLPFKAHVSIYNLQGKEISSATLEEGDQKMDISGIESGLYFVRIKDTNKLYSLKFIKE